VRDLAPNQIDPEAPEDDPRIHQALDAMLPELVAQARDVLVASSRDRDVERRLKTQLGGDEPTARLPIVLNALKSRSLLDKAQAFGRAANGIQDEAMLASALQAMPLNDHSIAALLFQATMGQMSTPHRMMLAAIRVTNSNEDGALVRAGFGPLIDAILSHAQNQIAALSVVGPFADIDLTCRAIDRFHRLVRAVSAYVEMGRGSPWTIAIAGMTKTISARIEPKLADVVMDVNKALRRHRDGADRLDSDQLLSALNALYVLATVRDSRDSLALNALFDQVWQQVGQALEIHIERNLENYRSNPADRIIGERLEAALKMAEIRFSLEYAEVLRRAKEAAEKR
jgi:hypothetical protein